MISPRAATSLPLAACKSRVRTVPARVKSLKKSLLFEGSEARTRWWYATRRRCRHWPIPTGRNFNDFGLLARACQGPGRLGVGIPFGTRHLCAGSPAFADFRGKLLDVDRLAAVQYPDEAGQGANRTRIR